MDVHVDYVKPAEDGYEERVCVTLKLDDMYGIRWDRATDVASKFTENTPRTRLRP